MCVGAGAGAGRVSYFVSVVLFGCFICCVVLCCVVLCELPCHDRRDEAADISTAPAGFAVFGYSTEQEQEQPR